MASTPSSTQADERFDGGVAPTMAKDRFTDVGEALAGGKLRRQRAPLADAPERGLDVAGAAQRQALGEAQGHAWDMGHA
jgi:hypothetical protein